MKNIKKALKNGEVVFGASILSSDPVCVEIAGYAGFDFVFIDSEHAPASPIGKEMGELIRAAYAADVTPIVRIIDCSDFSQIRKGKVNQGDHYSHKKGHCNGLPVGTCIRSKPFEQPQIIGLAQFTFFHISIVAVHNYPTPIFNSSAKSCLSYSLANSLPLFRRVL